MTIERVSQGRTSDRRFEKAVKQLANAANNLSAIAADYGDEAACYAAKLCNMLLNSIDYGPCYKVAVIAAEYDCVNEANREATSPRARVARRRESKCR